MARSANAAATVLESLRVLHTLGAEVELPEGTVIAAFETLGITGITPDEKPYLAMVSVVLRLLLRHAAIDPEAMFDAAIADLAELGRDIDDETFNEIARRYDGD